MISVTVPSNIAVVKYWGKSDIEKNLPLNDSLSIALDALTSTTTLLADDTISSDVLLLDNKNTALTAKHRKMIDFCRSKCRDRSITRFPLRIESFNNFPTGAGLASSASGMAALALCLQRHYNLEGEVAIEEISRLGSGSSVRSLLGGFVEWRCDGSIERLGDQWPELAVIVVIISDEEKSINSTDAMIRSTQTSELLAYRASEVVPRRMAQIKQAIRDKNFAAFAEATMKESNQLHACCLDTFPPILYLNQTTYALIQFIHEMNARSLIAAYTCDAGANCHLILPRDKIQLLLDALRESGRFYVSHASPSLQQSFRVEVGTSRPSPDQHVIKDLILSGISDGYEMN